MLNAYVPSSAFAITPSDTRELPEVAYCLYAKTAGNITYQDARGAVWTDAVAAGGIVTTTVIKVLATGTTATGIRGYRKDL